MENKEIVSNIDGLIFIYIDVGQQRDVTQILNFNLLARSHLSVPLDVTQLAGGLMLVSRGLLLRY